MKNIKMGLAFALVASSSWAGKEISCVLDVYSVAKAESAQWFSWHPVSGAEMGEEDNLHLALPVNEDTGELGGTAWVHGRNRDEELKHVSTGHVQVDLAGFRFDVRAHVEPSILFGRASMSRPPKDKTSDCDDESKKSPTDECGTTPQRRYPTHVSASASISHGDVGSNVNLVNPVGPNQVLTFFTADKKATMMCSMVDREAQE